MYVDNQYDRSLVYNRSAACFLRYETVSAPEEWNNVIIGTSVVVQYSILKRKTPQIKLMSRKS